VDPFGDQGRVESPLLVHCAHANHVVAVFYLGCVDSIDLLVTIILTDPFARQTRDWNLREEPLRAFECTASRPHVAVGGWLFFCRMAHAVTDGDTIVLADFTNTTGDPVFGCYGRRFPYNWNNCPSASPSVDAWVADV
jgi:hypothetical protein